MTKLPELLDEEFDDSVARKATFEKVLMKSLSPVTLLLFMYFTLKVIDIEGWSINFGFIIGCAISMMILLPNKTRSSHIYDISKNKKHLKIYTINALNKRRIIEIPLDKIKKIEVSEKKIGFFKNELRIHFSKSIKICLYNGEKITQVINN